MTRSRNGTIFPTLFAIALAFSCATAETPGGDDKGDLVDSGIDILPPRDGGGSGSDAGSGCPTSPCDLHEQCGCGATEACDLEFTNFAEGEFTGELACRQMETPGTELSACSDASKCDKGYQCIGGQCRRYCQNDDVCGGPGGRCVYTRTGSERTDDSLCSKSCEPDFEADHSASCPKDFSCYVVSVGADDNQTFISDCLPTGTAGVNGDCSSNRCAEGLACIVFTSQDGSESRRCLRRCRVADQECPGDDNCQGFDTPTLIDGTEYGICN